MIAMLAFGWHHGHGFEGLAFLIFAGLTVAAILLLSKGDNSDGKKG